MIKNLKKIGGGGPGKPERNWRQRREDRGNSPKRGVAPAVQGQISGWGGGVCLRFLSEGRQKRESACKPGSVEDNHSSWTHVAMRLQQPTRGQCGPHYRPPIWSCSRRGLPCHGCCQPCGALLPHHFTLTSRATRGGGMFSVALSVGSHRPGVTWRPALRSPDFPLPAWDGANQRRPLGLTAIARLTPACHPTTKTGVRPHRLARSCGGLGGVLVWDIAPVLWHRPLRLRGHFLQLKVVCKSLHFAGKWRSVGPIVDITR